MARRRSKRPQRTPTPKPSTRRGPTPADKTPTPADTATSASTRAAVAPRAGAGRAGAGAAVLTVAGAWTVRDRLVFVMLLVDSVLLAVVELLFLPLRFDGVLLPDLDGFPLPVTALLAAVTMPWLVSLAGRLSPRLAVASAPLVVWVLAIGVFGLAGPGGDRVLIEDWRSLLLLAGGALPAAVKLGSG